MTEIITIAQQLQSLATDGATLDQIEAPLQALWAEAEEQQNQGAMNQIAAVWQNAQALDVQRQHLEGIASAAVQIANEMVSQRDHIADQLGSVAKAHMELEEAVKNCDTNHPAVEVLYETAEETVWEYVSYMEGARSGIHIDEPGEYITDSGHFGEVVDGETAEDFLNIVIGSCETLSDALLNEIAQQIVILTNKARAEWAATRASRQAAHAAWMKEHGQAS